MIVIIILIGSIFSVVIGVILIVSILSGDYFCRVGHGTCKAAKSARHLIESKEKNRSSRVKVFSTHINLSHPAASWLATQTCANNIFHLLQNNNAIYLFENIKEIKLKNDTTYVSLPNPTILITTTSTPERQFSISVLDDDNKENLPTDTAPCFTIGIPDEYTKAIELLNIK